MDRGNGRGKGKKRRKKRKNLTFKEERLFLISSWSIREKMTNSFLFILTGHCSIAITNTKIGPQPVVDFL